MTEGASGGGHAETGGSPPPTPTLSARLGADVIDLSLLAVSYLVVSFAIGAVAVGFGVSEGLVQDIRTARGVAIVAVNIGANLAVQLGYWAYVEGGDGRSFGKRLTGLRVVHTDGTAIGPGTAVRRKLPFYAPITLGWIPVVSQVAFLLMLLVMAGGLASYVADRPTLRGFHDRWAATKVIPTGE